MQSRPFSIIARLQSFRFAISGIRKFFLQEHNARVHLAATVLVFLMARFFSVSPYEWIALILAMALVWITEILNTAVEKTLDHLSPDRHAAVAYIKDLAAGAVLLSAIVAAIIGLIIFIPKIF